MWTYYYNVTETVAEVPTETLTFIGIVILTAFMVLAPSFFERKKK